MPGEGAFGIARLCRLPYYESTFLFREVISGSHKPFSFKDHSDKLAILKNDPIDVKRNLLTTRGYFQAPLCSIQCPPSEGETDHKGEDYQPCEHVNEAHRHLL